MQRPRNDLDSTPLPPAKVLHGYGHFRFGADGITRDVYHAGDVRDPPVLVVCELAGFSPGLLLFCDRLRHSGFQVHVPWLFGPFGRRAPVRNALRLCISREFSHLRAGTTAPIANWLRTLAGHISRQQGNRQVGAIGMCLTGAFVIPLVIDSHVGAAIAAQPAIPCSLLFAVLGIRSPRSMRALNVDAQDIALARERLSTGAARLLAVRARADRICPAEKIERLREEFPIGMDVREYGELSTRNCLGGRPHALLTKEHRLEPDAPPGHWAHDAFADITLFLKRYLQGSSELQPAARASPM